MNRGLGILLVAIALPATSAVTWAANQLTVSTTAVPSMNVNSATAGSQPNPVNNSTTTYGVQTNAGTTQRIVGRLNSSQAGITVQCQLTPPPGASGQGLVSLTMSDQNLVTGIPGGTNASGLTITYVVTATVSAAPQTWAPQVTFSLLNP
ncbi:MAG: hypothetical protein HY815_03970 [Candidatus Riflebacteria bacterium]|nr:hypothetical protein [Candidatus Riflebacteria bacterium]